MDDFIKIFAEIDTNNDSEITTEEIVDYANKNNLSSSMVPRWKNLFDPDNNGVITLENFLDGLGLKMDEYLNYKKNTDLQSQNIPQLPPDVEKISGDMHIDQQIAIVEEIRKYSSNLKSNDFKSTAEAIKKYLDQHYKTTWHVVIAHSSFASAFTHEIGTAFTFKMFGLCFNVWKTQERGNQ